MIYSQPAICFEFTMNGLHGLSGLCGLHVNHRVWQERGITSEALVFYGSFGANLKTTKNGHAWSAWSLWSGCKLMGSQYCFQKKCKFDIMI